MGLGKRVFLASADKFIRFGHRIKNMRIIRVLDKNNHDSL